MTVDEDYVAPLNGVGLDVWAHTVNTAEEAEGQHANGAVGVFADNPWLMTGTPYK